MGEQNNVSTQNKDENPVAKGCGCLCVVIGFLLFVPLFLDFLHLLLKPIKRIIELLYDVWLQ